MTSETWEQRHARAAEVMGRFAPGVEPERMAAGMIRRHGALGSFTFDAVGHMWSRPELSRRDRSLLVISTLAAQARDEELAAHTKIGLQHGLTRVEIEELLLHVAAYAGFPAAMASVRVVDGALREVEGVERLEGGSRPSARTTSSATVTRRRSCRRWSAVTSATRSVRWSVSSAASARSRTAGRSVRSGPARSSPAATAPSA